MHITARDIEDAQRSTPRDNFQQWCDERLLDLANGFATASPEAEAMLRKALAGCRIGNITIY